MGNGLKKINWKFVLVMIIGNIILGLGIAIFKLSDLEMPFQWNGNGIWLNVWELNMQDL